MVVSASLVYSERARAIEIPVKCGMIINTRTCGRISDSRVSKTPYTSEMPMKCGKILSAFW
jgi:hypothetical protein